LGKRKRPHLGEFFGFLTKKTKIGKKWGPFLWVSFVGGVVGIGEPAPKDRKFPQKLRNKVF